MRHYFLPFPGGGGGSAARGRSWTARTVAGCLEESQVVLVGDSRMTQMATAIRYIHSNSTYPLMIRTDYYPNLGLAALTKEPMWSTMKGHILAGRTVVINSLLHDLAAFTNKIASRR
jgi:hypothetical protein